MADVIQIRGGTASDAASVNPVLASREFGFETDTRRLKIGDGSTAYNDLDYLIVPHKDNLSATVNPTSSDDVNVGYDVRSFWINASTNMAFICVDNTANAAIWQPLTQTQHDLQVVYSTTTYSSSSTSYVSDPDLTLTTKNLNGTGVYTVFFTGELQCSNANATIVFRLIKNGSVVPNSVRRVEVLGKNKKTPYSVHIPVFGVTVNDVFGVQYKTNAGTLKSLYRVLFIDGISESEVV